MRGLSLRTVALALCVLAVGALAAAGASAQPATWARGTLNQSFSTKRPNAPVGLSYSAAYHSAKNAKAPPPYMRKMIFYPPKGFRYDTTVPARCTAPDAALEALGPDACPRKSLIGGGSVEGLFLFPIAHQFTFDHYRHHVDILNGANQQILLVKSEGYTVVRGRMRPDGSLLWATPTCFPAPPTGCADDYIIQLKSLSVIPRLTRRVHGRVRSYETTPARCPRRGYWKTTVRFWWKGGAVDSVVSKQPCRRPRRA